MKNPKPAAETSYPARPETSVPAARKGRFWPFVLAGVVIGALYATHLFYCQRSPLKLMDVAMVNMDMHANLLWAKGIREQGWLNAVPYHPWADWMQRIAPYPQWVEWGGGERVFQQSPLYPYLLSLFIHRYFSMRVFQALLSIGTCVFIGLLTARIANSAAGWTAFWLAALYAPFYVYSWPYLRDGLGWFLTAAVLWALSELTHSEWSSGRARLFAWLVGMLLGLGYLARETYLLLVPMVWVVLAGFAWRRQQWGMVARVALVTVLTISPLLIRNWCVKAPLLASSNRIAGVVIWGNSGATNPYTVGFTPEMGRILRETHSQPLAVLHETLASHRDGIWGIVRLQLAKLLSLFDPYEAPDNLSFYFVAHISPVVRLGLRYWMILPIGVAGLVLSIRRRELAHLWMWMIFSVFLLSLFIAVPTSRYRQGLMIFLIPLAAYFLVFLAGLLRRGEIRPAVYCGVALLAGWALILGPLSRWPRQQYERPQEYLVSATIFHWFGEDQKADEMLAFVRRRFPGILPP